jgi:DNA polymerase-4
VAVSLHGLSRAADMPADLFDSPGEGAQAEKWRSISATLDALNARFGRSVVSIGPQVDLPGGYAGAKIAFGRIPDEQDF